MNNKFARFILAALLALAVLLMPTSALAATYTYTESEEYPATFLIFVPCANGGAGENVELTGYLHVLSHITYDASNGVHLSQYYNYQSLKGTGLITGDTYRAAGGQREVFNGKVQTGTENTFVSSFVLNGPRRGNHFLFHLDIHVTVHPDGTVTGYHSNYTVECR